MRNTLLTTLFVFMTVALGTSPAAAQVAAGDSVTGTASSSFAGPPPFLISFSFNAHSGPSGEHPTGTAGWHVNSPFGDFGGGGNVTCLHVNGTFASVGTFGGGTATFFFVSGRSVGFGAFATTTAPTVCPTVVGGQPFDQAFGPLPMDDFGIVIVDAPPLPTSKEQCKNGGWRNIPGFKNEGDCVAFVATGGKNQPSGQ
jgi:hypothetical protein